MKTILFYTANGVGLGHLQRSFLIAKKIKSKDRKIILVTSAFSPQIFGKFFDSLIQLIPLSDKLLNSSSKTREARINNGQKFAKAIKKFKPDIIIADFYLTSPFTFYALKHTLDRFPIQSVFIWRLSDSQKFYKDFNDENDRLDYFQKIILPHSQKELKSLLSLSFFKKIKNNNRFSITGPILKKIDKKKIDFCRKKYKISSRDFLIVVTLGGGGKFIEGQCDAPERIIKKFLNIYPSLINIIQNLKVIIIAGPYLQNLKKKSSSQLKFIRFEKNILELIKLSDLVISTAGYNTCNELLTSKTPAILTPLMRGDKEQFERASYLEKKGILKVSKNDSSHQLFNLIIDCKKNLNRMKSNFKKFSDWKQCNNKTAKEILKLLK